LNELEMLVRANVCRPLEKHMLEEVRESGSAGPLIGGTHMIPEINRHDWSGMILGQCDKKPVIKLKSFYGNSHVVN
jgi:hypothetical protein